MWSSSELAVKIKDCCVNVLVSRVFCCLFCAAETRSPRKSEKTFHNIRLDREKQIQICWDTAVEENSKHPVKTVSYRMVKDHQEDGPMT